MNSTVKQILFLIETLGLSKNKFMQSIGCSHVALINWEKGNNIADKTLLLIEKTYNVNPTWLRDGEGEMFLNDVSVSEPALTGVNGEMVSLSHKLKGKYAKKVLTYMQEQLKFQEEEDASEQARKNVV